MFDVLIDNLDTSKGPSNATTYKGIPAKSLKKNSDIYQHILTDMINNTINTSVFPKKLKEADVTPIHKKEGTTNKANYRPVSILPTVSKVYERLLFQQIVRYMESKLSGKPIWFHKRI